MRSLCLALGAAIALAVGSGPAAGHSNEYLASITGTHGGRVRMAEMYHFELVVAAGSVQVWVTDHSDRPISTVDASASAVVLSGDDKVVVSLTPAGQNRLSGKDPRLGATPLARVALTVTMPGHAPLQVRYSGPHSPAAVAGE